MGTLQVSFESRKLFTFEGTAESIPGVMNDVENWVKSCDGVKDANELSELMLHDLAHGRLDISKLHDEETMLLLYYLLQRRGPMMRRNVDSKLSDNLLHHDLGVDMIPVVNDDGEHKIRFRLFGEGLH